MAVYVLVCGSTPTRTQPDSSCTEREPLPDSVVPFLSREETAVPFRRPSWTKPPSQRALHSPNTHVLPPQARWSRCFPPLLREGVNQGLVVLGGAEELAPRGHGAPRVTGRVYPCSGSKNARGLQNVGISCRLLINKPKK